MQSISLSNPRYRPSKEIVDRLNRAVAQEVLGGKQTEFLLNERKKLSDRLAIEASLTALESLRHCMAVEDANLARRNQPGYDLLLDGRVRVQVKGGTYVDSIGFTHTSGNLYAADLDYDVLFLVDIGSVLNPRPFGFRKDGRDNIPVKEWVDIYVVPNTVVRQEVTRGAYITKKGAHLYLYKRHIRPGTREYNGQWFALMEWQNRFDVVEQMLSFP